MNNFNKNRYQACKSPYCIQRPAPRGPLRLYPLSFLELAADNPNKIPPRPQRKPLEVSAAERAMTCCFSGHRTLSELDRALIRERLDDTLYSLIDRGVRIFKTGGALGFDTIAALHVLEMRERFPDVRLILELPCRDQCRGWQYEDIVLYKKILGKCDEMHYVSDFYYRGCMHERNRRLVDGSGYCVFFLKQTAGGTASTYKYANTGGAEIINLAGSGAGGI